MPRFLTRALLAVALLAILSATLYPTGDEDLAALVLCIVCGEHGTADAIVNLMLFLPLGAGLALTGWPVRWALLGAALLSSGIELAQLLIIPGRDPSLGDMIFNTLGATAGMALVGTARFWVSPPAARRRALLVAATAAVAGLFLLTGWLLRPALPDSRYVGQWTPNLGHLTWYRARVLDASLDTLRLPGRRLPDPAAVRRLLLGGATLTVRAVAGPPTGGVGSLFSIYDDQQREIVLLGPDRADFVFRIRSRAADLRLDEPDLRLLGATRSLRRGDSITVEVRHTSDGWCLALNARATCGLGFTLGRAWAILLHPESFPQWLRRLLDTGWLAGLLLPLGLWARRDAATIAAAGVVAAAAAIIPVTTGLQPLTPLELLGALTGVAIGHLLANLLGRSGTAGRP